MNGIRAKIFFSIIPFWLKIMPGRGFFFFVNFFASFFRIFLPGSRMNLIRD